MREAIGKHGVEESSWVHPHPDLPPSKGEGDVFDTLFDLFANIAAVSAGYRFAGMELVGNVSLKKWQDKRQRY